jgi:hypothetical protein
VDTPSSESALTVDGAAAAWADIIDPPAAAEPAVDTEIDPPKKEAEPEATPNAAEEGDDAPITVEVDGKQVTLTKAQVADAYKNGLRQSDYTQKTMAVAEARKAAEAETSKAQQERMAYAQNLTKMAAQLEGALQQQAQIDWNALLESDPVEFLKQQHLSNQRQAALQKNQQEQQTLAQQFQAEQAKAHQDNLSTQQQELLAKLPEWKDEAKAKSERDALKTYLKTQGYDDGAINGISDHKAVILSRKAMLYDQMMSKAQAAAKRVSALPTKVERPGVASDRSAPDGRTAAMQRLHKSGSVEDAAAVFASLL